MSKYSIIKRIVQAVPGLRTGLAGAFTWLPLPLSAWVYDAMRRYVFRDNQQRHPVFEAAVRTVSQHTGGPIDVLEFGVARGTSVITLYKIARAQGVDVNIYAFDSFAGLPAGEGSFSAGDMAYSQDTFLRFARKAGVPTQRITCTAGFFDRSLTEARKAELGLNTPRPILVHCDVDLYVSARDVLAWVTSMAASGSVIVFDDWYCFDDQPDASQHGEQRAFAEWPDRQHWRELAQTPGWNMAFVKA